MNNFFTLKGAWSEGKTQSSVTRWNSYYWELTSQIPSVMFTTLSRECPLMFLSTKFKHRPMCCLCLLSLDTWSGTPVPVQSIGTVQQLSHVMSLWSLECAGLCENLVWRLPIYIFTTEIRVCGCALFRNVFLKLFPPRVCDSGGPIQQHRFCCCNFFFLFMSSFNAFLCL